MFFDNHEEFEDELERVRFVDDYTPYYDPSRLRKYVKTVANPSSNSFLYHGEWVEFHNLQDFMHLLLRTDFNVDLNTQTFLSKLDLADEIERLEDKITMMPRSVEVDDLIYDMRTLIGYMEFVVQKGFNSKECDELNEHFNIVLADYIHDDKAPTKDFLLYLNKQFDMLKNGDQTAKAKFQEYITKITDILNRYGKDT